MQTGDLNGDRIITGAVLLRLLQTWGLVPGRHGVADMDGNCNCAVDGADLPILRQNWG